MMDIYGTVERAKEKIEEITDFAVGLYEEESMVAKIKMNCATLFHPHQLGVALPRGAEIGVHTLRQYITSKHETDKVILKIDYKNAKHVPNWIKSS